MKVSQLEMRKSESLEMQATLWLEKLGLCVVVVVSLREMGKRERKLERKKERKKERKRKKEKERKRKKEKERKKEREGKEREKERKGEKREGKKKERKRVGGGKKRREEARKGGIKGEIRDGRRFRNRRHLEWGERSRHRKTSFQCYRLSNVIIWIWKRYDIYTYVIIQDWKHFILNGLFHRCGGNVSPMLSDDAPYFKVTVTITLSNANPRY